RTLSPPTSRWYPPRSLTCETTTLVVSPPPTLIKSPSVPGASGISAATAASFRQAAAPTGRGTPRRRHRVRVAAGDRSRPGARLLHPARRHPRLAGPLHP